MNITQAGSIYSPSLFHPFTQPVDNITLPSKFTFPFYYQPHPLALIACQQLQDWLTTDSGVHGGIDTEGKMFGILVVENQQGQLGYLVAYSGAARTVHNNHYHFCPNINAATELGADIAREQSQINQLTDRIAALANNGAIDQLSDEIAMLQRCHSDAVSAQQTQMIHSRKARKQQRQDGNESLSTTQYVALQQRLATQSIAEKNTLKAIKIKGEQEIAAKVSALQSLTTPIEALQLERKTRSNALQQIIFSQYPILNRLGEVKNLNAIFSQTSLRVPPAGAGDCAAPKLIQSAYHLGFKPIALAEFWWGKSPVSQIRQHQQFYPACIGKCEPILNFMLQGLQVDDNPLLDNKAVDLPLDIIHQDESFLVINKPSGLLSVPGKHVSDSVKTRIQDMFPQAKGGIIVHRLDMATSGLMLVALTQRAHKNLQHQFLTRAIDKCYEAIVTGTLEQSSGVIELPLCGDFADRPRQKVCEATGKHAYTSWQVIERKQGNTRLTLWPKTGRTHQLRVHCAHVNGLNSSIVGDDLYGKPAERLMLHAKKIAFNHPINKQAMTFEIASPF